MRKALSIALGLSIALVGVSTTQAGVTPAPQTGQRIIEQEQGRRSDQRLFHDARPAAPAEASSLGQQISRQELGRRSDAGLFGPSRALPVQVVGPPDGFDVRDAALGGAAGIALALLAAAALAGVSRRPRADRAAPAES
jgi:hypothetical protein